jgi:hypothetical protein
LSPCLGIQAQIKYALTKHIWSSVLEINIEIRISSTSMDNGFIYVEKLL